MSPDRQPHHNDFEKDISILAGEAYLEGTLGMPKDSAALVLFAHGSGSSRHSPRNRFVARQLQASGIGTLLFDLLMRSEERIDETSGSYRFDIPFLANRLVTVTRWLLKRPDLQRIRLGYFGASTGAAAALRAAAEMPDAIGAVVSRGGRPDLAGDSLKSVRAPTLLIVGGEDGRVIEMNQQALAQLGCSKKKLIIVPGATHLFEEPGTLEDVARLAAAWFQRHLTETKKPNTRPSTRR